MTEETTTETKPEGEETKPSQADQEARARRMGWIPKDEYGGDPSRWVTAEEFIRKGEEEMPILRERLRKQDQSMAEMHKLLEDVVSHQKEQTKRAVDEAISKARAERREAVRDGDVEKVDKLDEQIDELKEQKAEASQKTTKADVPQEFVEWAQRESWFAKDKALNKFAIAHYDLLLENPGLTDAERLRMVSKEVRKRYPEKFTQRKPAASDVEGGSSAPKSTGTKGYSDLPPEAKKICDRLCKEIPGYTKDKYLKAYAW